MQGKRVFITGATNGIGLAAAQSLASQGALVDLLCRNPERGAQVSDELTRLSPSGYQSATVVADMADLSQLRSELERYTTDTGPVDILLNNAGVVMTRRALTVDGFETSFAVNHLAPFLITGLLMPNLLDAEAARVVTVSSHAHTFVKGMNFGDLHSAARYRTFDAYGQSKLANLLFNLELSTRLQGTGVTANALHPGAVATGLGTQNGVLGKLLMKALSPFFKSPEQGAATSIYLCTSDEVAGMSGGYYVNCRLTDPKPWALDDKAAQRLWAISSELTGIDYPG